RARANILREFLTNSPKKNPFDHKEIYEIMDLCLSCKACKSECPSSVDIAKLKAEFLQHYYDANGVPLRSLAVAYLPFIHAIGSWIPGIMNFFMKNRLSAGIMKTILTFDQRRHFPLLQKTPLRRWAKKYVQDLGDIPKKGKVCLFTDEFTNFLDTGIGIKAIILLNKLGYEVILPEHSISARTFLSKGLVRSARKIARKNISALKDLITEETPLIGVEPSAILAFRDEYPDLINGELKEATKRISENTFLFDEFFAKEVGKGKISSAQFTDAKQHIKLHGHCQQKAVASTETTLKMLSFPENYTAEEIPSGCCGMAGAFGFEKEHYDLSMKIGEMVLFPAVREAPADTLISAPGTSCRQQIKDGTGREALHPVEIMYAALKN
ncbi:FAD-binding oxidoreductase, partial [bacterium]|nr:FAD-binding oxidoreductase [bacterium]